MKKKPPAVFLMICFTFLCATASHAAIVTTPSIGIGAGETAKESHLGFPDLPQDLVRVSAHLIVDKAPKEGLNFFAVQVDWPNNTWAHGGPQFVDGKKLVNWGGLVDRGGGAADYEQSNEAKDILLMQNPDNEHHTVPFQWSLGQEYVITIERGNRVTLPPGTYTFIEDTPPVRVTAARTMWEWNLTIAPVNGKDPTFRSTLYNTAATFGSFSVWNECGYGSCELEQHAFWSVPVYARATAPDQDIQVQSWERD